MVADFAREEIFMGKGIATVGIWIAVAVVICFGHITSEVIVVGATISTLGLWGMK